MRQFNRVLKSRNLKTAEPEMVRMLDITYPSDDKMKFFVFSEFMAYKAAYHYGKKNAVEIMFDGAANMWAVIVTGTGEL